MNIDKGVIIQVAVGVGVITLVYMLAMWIMQRDEILDHEVAYMRPNKLGVDIIRGYGDLARISDKQWSTMNQAATNFLPIIKSYNRRGGLQFSYTFWIKVSTQQGGAKVADQSILLQGDRRLFRWRKITDGDTDMGIATKTEDAGPAVLVKCPHIRFGRAFDELVVEFNTLQDPDASFTITSDPAPGPGARRNALSTIQGRWAMLTFAFEDNVGISDFEDGIMVRFYLNEDLYYTHRQKGAFRRNQGNLFLAPGFDQSAQGVLIGDIKYFNYAMPPNDVTELYRRGPPKRMMEELQQSGESTPLALSEYNKLDVYNST